MYIFACLFLSSIMVPVVGGVLCVFVSILPQSNKYKELGKRGKDTISLIKEICTKF